VRREVDQVLASGFEIKLNTQVGADVSLENLQETHDAVILAAGTLTPH